jgi:hypothetical protein
MNNENQVGEQQAGQTTSNYSGAFLLILFGVFFLLSNFGVLSWSVWEIIARFWPSVLILMGLEIILGKVWFKNLIIMASGLFFCAALFGLIWWLFGGQIGFDWINQAADWFFKIIPGLPK